MRAHAEVEAAWCGDGDVVRPPRRRGRGPGRCGGTLADQARQLPRAALRARCVTHARGGGAPMRTCALRTAFNMFNRPTPCHLKFGAGADAWIGVAGALSRSA